MARGLWKGAISFGLVNVPVELFHGAPEEERGEEAGQTQAQTGAPRPAQGGIGET